MVHLSGEVKEDLRLEKPYLDTACREELLDDNSSLWYIEDDEYQPVSAILCALIPQPLPLVHATHGYPLSCYEKSDCSCSR